MSSIEEAFTNESYVTIPFSFNGVGQPLIQATLAGNIEANFLLDTGAAISLLDYEFAKRLKLNLTPTGEKGGGAGGTTSEIYGLDKFSLAISGQLFTFESFFSMDFSSIHEALTSRGVVEEVHGILGFGFFTMTKCFIDYSGNRIFVLNNNP